MMGTARHVLRNDAVSWTPTDAEGAVVALDLRSSRYLSLNASGSVLWTLLADGATQPDLVAALVDQFGLTEGAASVDVAAFLQALRERDLVTD